MHRLRSPAGRRAAAMVLVGIPATALGASAAYRAFKRPQLPPHTVPDLHGRTVVVTGATSGIGEQAALQLAARGATMVIGSRDPARGAVARERLLEVGAPTVDLHPLDLSSMRSVAAFCDDVLRTHPRLDVLVSAAAEIRTSPSLSADGVNAGFATNHLGLHALCMGLEPALLRPPPAAAAVAELPPAARPRVVIVGSRLERKGSGTLSLSAIESTHGARIVNIFSGAETSPMDHYAATKHANMLLAQSLGEKWGESGPAVLVVTPGMVHTNLWRNYSLAYRTATYPFRAVGLRSPHDAALGVTFAAAAVEAESDALGNGLQQRQERERAYVYLSDGVPIEPSDRARDSADAALLFASCDRLLAHCKRSAGAAAG